ncbi:endonuclease NucS domain-containing protein [Proteiniphilum sp.]|uniref:endonuclease NucS domain-containing protein n=1 Tax=Proteiniphilum sp. TaxID=1926877 RepID=UPI0033201282
MKIFQQNKSDLKGLKEKPFKLEKEIQKIVENNLDQVSGYQVIKSEFTIKSNRIDTLAFDEENRSFVIIEYKRDRNYSVVDQGVSYLNLMLEYKADFIVEYNESQKNNLKRNEVDWSQSKVIFVAPSFTDFQRQSSNFKDLPIELWEIKRFENEIIVINPVKKSQSAPSIKQVQTKEDSTIGKVVEEIKVYTEEDHLAGKSEEIIELYETYKNAILNLATDIELFPKKLYIAFKKDKNLADIHVQQKGLKIWINMHKGDLDDPKNITNDVSRKGHWGNGDYEVIVSDTQNLEYIMSLIKQVIG